MTGFSWGSEPLFGCVSAGHHSGDYEGAAAKSHGYEEAGPFVTVVRLGGDSGGVENYDPEKEHDAEKGRGEWGLDSGYEGNCGGDECGACEVGEEEMSGNPGRYEGGDKWGVDEVLPAEGDHGDGEEIEAARGESIRDCVDPVGSGGFGG